MPFCPLLSRRGGVIGDFGGAVFLVGGTETAAGAEADGSAECVGGVAEAEGVLLGLAPGEGGAAAGVLEGFPVEPPDPEPEQPVTARPGTSTVTSSAAVGHGPRFRTIAPPK
ncbi:hypothetical protein ACFVXE_20650 [Streptomyces sp. NPDC058231]|uniref:hypothetical protein n=1 Tax=Streptomyces sp. NPDC058231 TaxID=3346392 RepID=UPI0036F0FC4D